MMKFKFKSSNLLMGFILFQTGCLSTPTSVTTSTGAVTANASSGNAFVSGTSKAVKIITSDSNGSFQAPSVLTTSAVIGSNYPGYDGVSSYNPGISASQYFDLTGATLAQPNWLIDFQLGLTDLPPSNSSPTCATFGGTSSTFDSAGYYRVSEANCAAYTGTGLSTDPIFFRIVLNRSNSVLGSAENLMVQVEYQASGLRFNADSSTAPNGDTNPEDFVDQVWKIFTNTSLSPSNSASVFSLFIPPNYSACVDLGSTTATGTSGSPGSCVSGYSGAPNVVKQFIIPLSAYPSLSVIQFSRTQGRINQSSGTNNGSNYVNSFCSTSNSPLCLGLVLHSVSLMRI